MLIFLFLRLHRPQRLHNIELGDRGIRELTLEVNKTEQMLKYRKAQFPKSASTTFVAHCSFILFVPFFVLFLLLFVLFCFYFLVSIVACVPNLNMCILLTGCLVFLTRD